MKALLIASAFGLFLSSCAHHMPVITAETEPPKWRPHVLINSVLVPEANRVKLVFKDLGLENELRPTDQGWMLILTPELIKTLLQGKDHHVHIVDLNYQVRNEKGRTEHFSKTIEVVIFKPVE